MKLFGNFHSRIIAQLTKKKSGGLSTDQDDEINDKLAQKSAQDADKKIDEMVLQIEDLKTQLNEQRKKALPVSTKVVKGRLFVMDTKSNQWFHAVGITLESKEPDANDFTDDEKEINMEKYGKVMGTMAGGF